MGPKASIFELRPDQGNPSGHGERADDVRRVISAIAAGKHLIIVTGDSGIGKTTLVQTALRDLADRAKVGMVSNPPAWTDDVLPWFLGAFGLPATPDPGDAVLQIHAFARQTRHAGRVPVLCIDEAHNLSDAALSRLREACWPPDEDDATITVVLVGQPELQQKFEGAARKDIADRISLNIKLAPMDRDETAAFVRQFLQAGGHPAGTLDPSAIRAIHRISGGLRGPAISLCEMALAFRRDTGDQVISGDDIWALVAEGGPLTHLWSKAVPRREPPMTEKVALGQAEVAEEKATTAIYSLPDSDVIFFQESNPDFAHMRAIPLRSGFGAEPEALLPSVASKEENAPSAETSGAPVPPQYSSRRQALMAKRTAKRVFLSVGSLLAVLVAAVSLPDLKNTSSTTEDLSYALPAPLAIRPGPVPVAGPVSGEELMSRGISAGLTDPALAAVHFTRAALLGNGMAAYFLGQMYETGDGVPRDLTLARGWYEVAQESIAGAKRRLEQVAPAETSGDLMPPLPLFAGRHEGNSAEFVWSSGTGADPGQYILEVSAQPADAIRRYPAQTLSGMRVDDIGDARVWRVIAVAQDGHRYAVSNWAEFATAPLPEPVERPLNLGPGPLRPDVVLSFSAGEQETNGRIASIRSQLDEHGISYQTLPSSGPSDADVLSVLYAFAQDEDLAFWISDLVGAASVELIEDAADAYPDEPALAPVPGQVVIAPAPFRSQQRFSSR